MTKKEVYASISLILLMFLCGVVIGLFSGCMEKSDRITSPPTEPEITKVDSTNHHWCWTPPQEGTPVEFYVIVKEFPGKGPIYTFTPDTCLTITVPNPHKPYKIRVAGVDSLGRQGPWSLPGTYNPGKPTDTKPKEEPQ